MELVSQAVKNIESTIKSMTEEEREIALSQFTDEQLMGEINKRLNERANTLLAIKSSLNVKVD